MAERKMLRHVMSPSDIYAHADTICDLLRDHYGSYDADSIDEVLVDESFVQRLKAKGYDLLGEGAESADGGSPLPPRRDVPTGMPQARRVMPGSSSSSVPLRRRDAPSDGDSGVPMRRNEAPSGGVPLRRPDTPANGVPLRRRDGSNGVPLRRRDGTDTPVPLRRPDAPSGSTNIRPPRRPGADGSMGPRRIETPISPEVQPASDPGAAIVEREPAIASPQETRPIPVTEVPTPAPAMEAEVSTPVPAMETEVQAPAPTTEAPAPTTPARVPTRTPRASSRTAARVGAPAIVPEAQASPTVAPPEPVASTERAAPASRPLRPRRTSRAKASGGGEGESAKASE